MFVLLRLLHQFGSRNILWLYYLCQFWCWVRNKGSKSDKKLVSLFLNLNQGKYLLANLMLGVLIVIKVLWNKLFQTVWRVTSLQSQEIIHLEGLYKTNMGVRYFGSCSKKLRKLFFSLFFFFPFGSEAKGHEMEKWGRFRGSLLYVNPLAHEDLLIFLFTPFWLFPKARGVDSLI